MQLTIFVWTIVYDNNSLLFCNWTRFNNSMHYCNHQHSCARLQLIIFVCIIVTDNIWCTITMDILELNQWMSEIVDIYMKFCNCYSMYHCNWHFYWTIFVRAIAFHNYCMHDCSGQLLYAQLQLTNLVCNITIGNFYMYYFNWKQP